MPGTISWKGMKFYGSKAPYPDGTFVSTEWFVFLFFPVFPLGTKRVAYKGSAQGWHRSAADHLVIQKLHLDWAQVFTAYILAYGIPISTGLAGWFLGTLFAGKSWPIVIALIWFLAPILLAAALFFLVKPSSSPAPGVALTPEKYISRVVKPHIPPPPILSKPDTKPLQPLIEKLKPVLQWFMNHPDNPPEWLPVKQSFDDVLFLNYETISPYMEKEVYKNSPERRTVFEKQVRNYTSMASSFAWMLGKEWGQKDPVLKTELLNKETVKIKDIPVAALKLLENAVYFPYYVFAGVFTRYYDSPEGKDARYQKDRHMADTYQGMLKGMLIGFLIGISSAATFDTHASTPVVQKPVKKEPKQKKTASRDRFKQKKSQFQHQFGQIKSQFQHQIEQIKSQFQIRFEEIKSQLQNRFEQKKSASRERIEQKKSPAWDQFKQIPPPLTFSNTSIEKSGRGVNSPQKRRKNLVYIYIGVVLIILVLVTVLWIELLPKTHLGLSISTPSLTRTSASSPPIPIEESPQKTPVSPSLDCVLWSDLTRSDVGMVKCVYGRIVKIYHTDIYFEIIRFSADAGTFLIWDRTVSFPGISTDMCVKVVGLIHQDASELYMEIAGSKLDSYSGCP